MAFWSVAQSGRENAAHAKLPEEIFGKEPPMAVERQKALEAFHNPEAAAEEAAKNMTQEQWIAEQASILAITKPAAFTAEMEKFKTEEEKVKRQKAREAIVDPMKHSGPVKKGEKLPERVYNMEDFEKEKKQKAENQ